MLIRNGLNACLRGILVCVLALGISAPASAQGQSAPPPIAATLDNAKAQLDRIESTLHQTHLSSVALASLRTAIGNVRDALTDRLAQLEPQATQSQTRLQQLGSAPAQGAPPEDPAVAAERASLGRRFSELDGAVKQTRLLQTRADQIARQIADRQTTIFATRLLHRDGSVFDPVFWIEVAGMMPQQFANLGDFLHPALMAARENGATQMAVLAATFVLFASLVVAFSHWWRRRFIHERPLDSRLAKAFADLWVFAAVTLRTPLIVAVCLKILDTFGLLPTPLDSLGRRVLLAFAIASLGAGIGEGLLAPNRPTRRLVALSDPMAQCLTGHLVWASRMLAIAVVLHGLNAVLMTPPELVAATGMAFSAVIAALLVSVAICLRGAEKGDAQPIARGLWLRPVAWLLASIMILALALGYARVAQFFAVRLLVTVAVVGVAYLLTQAVDALFTDAIGEETPRGRAIARNIGVSPRNIGLVGMLLAGAIRVVVVLLALLLIVGPWEVSTTEVTGLLEGISLKLTIGEITISFRAIMAAAVVLVVTLLATRLIQRWLQQRLLPHTGIEPSLQLSIATIFGYLGVILAIMLALGGLGIDLQKIALVAGALSVGIGFGLQSIVSNFVSGLILLTERPIRVGDAIVVKGEEGWVRRIRVRATEIETYDRASVIVPNSELITGVVKNWTHLNTMGRVVVKVGVGYDSDPERMRDIMLEVANGHPQVLKEPSPNVYLTNFAEGALEFELRCLVSDVQNALSVKSDLGFAILKRLRAAGFALPLWGREERARFEEKEHLAALAAQPPPGASA
jgi:small-conductance mechanosensitive channel